MDQREKQMLAFVVQKVYELAVAAPAGTLTADDAQALENIADEFGARGVTADEFRY